MNTNKTIEEPKINGAIWDRNIYLSIISILSVDKTQEIKVIWKYSITHSRQSNLQKIVVNLIIYRELIYEIFWKYNIYKRKNICLNCNS